MMKILGILFLVTILVSGCGDENSSSVEDTPVKDDVAVEEATEFEGEYIVSAEYVVENMGNENILLVDCRGEKAAKKWTIEGAIVTSWQDLSTCSKEYGKAGDEGFGKIPEAADLEKRLGALGITKDKEIITLAHTSEGWGDDSRILWELVAAGYENVKVVDGGIDAVKAAGAATQKGASEPVPGEVSIDTIDMTHVMETETLAANYDDYVVLDVRTKKEYDGATLYGEAKGGHLPGAIYFPYLDLFESDGTLKANEEIVAMLDAVGVTKDDKIVTYCTGGIRSAYVQIVLEMCGYENTWNYDQSYCRWCIVHDVEK